MRGRVQLSTFTKRSGTARYLCEDCDAPIGEQHKEAMLAAGEWRATATATDPHAIGFHIGELWIYGSYTSSQSLSLGRVFWNAEVVDTLNVFESANSTITVAAGVASARIWARVMQDGLGGSPAGTIFARIERSANGGSTWTTVSEATGFHPGDTADQTLDVPEVTLAVSPGHQFRIVCGPSGTFGRISYGNDPSRTFLRVEWGA
ncbi:phage terminase large subunit family protein [Falsiroseomonas oryzae]|uniref:phage terminase large subunit family protein n=1 Tax=Falsiroseomonas oryzae TaxID=2766473 RepID=UPI0022EA5970|nr:phage terminase large subunit family protein [Roseomonas sp. MO-31]